MNPLTWISNMVGMMRGPSCEDVNSFLADYVEGVMDKETSAKFERHMEGCKCCGTYLADYKSLIEMTKDCDEIVIPEKLSEHTIEFLHSQMKDDV